MKLFRVFLLFLTALSLRAQVVVNEIMYHPASHDARDEWVELLNVSATNVNLSGWTISGGIDFSFPTNTILGAGKYLVVAAHQPTFASKFPTVTNVVGSWLVITLLDVNGRLLTNDAPVLSNSRNSVNLNNAAGDRVDGVSYADAGDWATRVLEPPDSGQRGWGWHSDADGLGSSLELRNAALPNQYGQNWVASPIGGPTPGRANASASANIPPMVVEVNHAPIIPRSTDPVSVTARVINETASGLTVTLWWRVDSASPPLFTPTQMFDDGAHGDASPGDGIYGIVLPAMFNNTLVEFYVEATDAQANRRSWPAPTMVDGTPTHDANAIFQVDDTTYSGNPPMYKLIMTTAQYTQLQTIFNNAPGSDAEVNCTFISIDSTGIDRRYLCGARNRGHGSRNGQPHNYRINFPDDNPWKGVTGFNINARVVSAQVVGAAIAQKAGAAGNRSRFVQLRVNNGTGPGGTPPNGLYAGDEDVTGDWAERQFPNNGNGNIYSVVRDIGPPNFDYRGEDPLPYQHTYFKQSNAAENDWQDLIGMLYVMGENQTNQFDIAAAREVVDVEQWLLHLAVMNLFGNNESGVNTGNNDDYYLYRGDRDPRFLMVYHDLDTILGLGGSMSAGDGNIFRATCCPISGDSEGIWRALNFFMHHPAVEPIYYRTLQNLLDTTFSQAQFDFIVDSVVADLPQVAGDAATMKNFMNTRRATVQGVINGHVPPVGEAPVATISGEPRSPTWRTSATITIGGSNIASYQWRLNNGAWSALTLVATPITLTGLANGSTNTIFVMGRSSNAVAQTGVTTSRTWVVKTATPTVRLNEVLARNVSAVNLNGNFPDVIELYNEGTSPVSLAGMRLTDDITDSSKYVFLPGASLAAGAYLVLSENDLGFALDGGGESLFLFDATGTNVLDGVAFGPQVPDLSIGRVGAGGTWLLTQPTFGGTNIVRTTGPANSIRINEWLAFGGASNPDDLVELYNPSAQPVDLAGHYLTDNPLGFATMHRMPELSFIGAGGFLVLTADGNADKPDHLNFQLAAEQGEIGLFSPQVIPIDCITYGPQHRDAPMGRCPDGANVIRTLVVPTFGFGNFCPAPPPGPQMVSIIPFSNSWRYHQFTNLDGVAWTVPGFDDSTWSNGSAVFGVASGGTPEPVRTVLTTGGNRITYYFRSTFNFPNGLAPTSLQFSNIIDDGAVFYINGNEVGRYNFAPGAQVTYSSLAQTVSGPPGWTTLPLAVTNVQPGLNTIAVEVHQNLASSPDIFFGTRLDALIVTNDPGSAGVVINEILASNSSYTNADGSTPDLVELYNPSTNAVDVGGMSFTDDPINPRQWVIPSGTILLASNYLVFQFDGDRPASALNAGFGLSGDGDRLYLLTAQTQVLDLIEFGLQPEDYSIGRVPNGSSNWVLTLPTLGTPNAAAPLGNLRNLKINEWMPAPASGDDWFEIYNPDPLPVRLSGCYLSDTVDQPTRYLPIADLSYIGAGTNAWKKIVADNNVGAGANHAPFRLNNTVEGLIISDPNGGLIDSITYSYASPMVGISEGLLPDGSNHREFFVGTDSPGEGNYLALADLVINEVLTHTDLPLEDAIELYNRGSSPVNISRWWLSDSRRKLRKYQIPANTTIPAGGYTVIYEARFNNSDVAAEAFALSSTGDEVYLSQVDGNGALTGYRAGADFGAAANGVSFGRFENTAGEIDYPALSRRTFGKDNALTVQEFRTGAGTNNAYPTVGPVVISEIMYHPPDIGTQDNVGHEFIELYNVTSNTVALYDPAHPTNTWRLRDAVDFDFPMGTTVAPGGHLLVVSFDPTNTTALNSFRTQYGTNFVLFGPYSGKLDNSDDDVKLSRPDSPNPGGKVPYILVDHVRYSDRAPWYPAADGFGYSLQRLSMSAYGNEPTNWTADVPAPGPSAAGDSDSDGMPDAWEIANGFNKNNAADANQDADGDGFTNLQEYRAGTNPRNAQSYLRIGPISSAPGSIVVEFPAAAGITYSILYRSELQVGPWARLIDIPAQSSAQIIRVFDPSPDAKRFYKLVTPSAP